MAYNALAVVWAALRSVHGASTVDQEVSGYYIAHEIAETHKGMMIAIPEPEWQVFVTMTTAELAVKMPALTQHVRLRAHNNFYKVIFMGKRTSLNSLAVRKKSHYSIDC